MGLFLLHPSQCPPDAQLRDILAIGLTAEQLTSAFGIATGEIEAIASGKLRAATSTKRRIDDFYWVLRTLVVVDSDPNQTVPLTLPEALDWITNPSTEGMDGTTPLQGIAKDPLRLLAAANQRRAAQPRLRSGG
jgi:hypothetical protein